MLQNKPGRIFAVVQKAGDKKDSRTTAISECTYSNQIKFDGNVHIIPSRLIFLQQLNYYVIWYNACVFFSKAGLVCTLL